LRTLCTTISPRRTSPPSEPGPFDRPRGAFVSKQTVRMALSFVGLAVSMTPAPRCLSSSVELRRCRPHLSATLAGHAPVAGVMATVLQCAPDRAGCRRLLRSDSPPRRPGVTTGDDADGPSARRLLARVPITPDPGGYVGLVPTPLASRELGTVRRLLGTGGAPSRRLPRTRDAHDEPVPRDHLSPPAAAADAGADGGGGAFHPEQVPVRCA